MHHSTPAQAHLVAIVKPARRITGDRSAEELRRGVNRDPKVQRSGDLAVLTFNLVDYGAQVNGGPKTTARWDSTEVCQRLNVTN
jgi:hypothetical protein